MLDWPLTAALPLNSTKRADEQANTMDTDVEKRIIGLEIELLRPEVRALPERLMELIADDFVELGQSGRRYRKADVLQLLPARPGTILHASDFESRILGPDTVLLTYLAENVIAAGRVSSRSLRSSIWQRREGHWQIVFHQGTSVKIAHPG